MSSSSYSYRKAEKLVKSAADVKKWERSVAYVVRDENKYNTRSLNQKL